MDVQQYIEDNRMYFWSTIGHPDTGRGEETQFEVDMGQDPVGAKIECVVMTGVHIGETRMEADYNITYVDELKEEEGNTND